MKFFLYYQRLISMIRHNFWQSFKKILYMGFRATLIFENLRWLWTPCSEFFKTLPKVAGGCDHKKWVHKSLKFHSFPREDKIKRKWISAISLRTKDNKWDASHRVCSAHFHGGHLYGSNNIPAIFPRRDLKTGKVVWPIDISHLLVEKTSEEDQRSSTVSVLVPKVIKWLPSHKNLRKHLLCYVGRCG